jgi:hypothetical protein
MSRLSSIVVLAAVFVVGFSGRAEAQFSTPVRDVENPARSMFLVTADVNLSDGQFGNTMSPVETAFIPAGKRLTLEFVSANCSAQTDQNLHLFLQLRQPGGGFSRFIRIPMTPMAVPLISTSQEWSAGQLVRLYADHHAAGSVRVSLSRTSSAGGTVFCDINLSGHTVSAQ